MATRRPPPTPHPLLAALDSTWQALQHHRDRWLADRAAVETLHELRVAWRRLRVVLDLLRREAAFDDRARAVKTAGRPLAQLSSPLRDLDVLAAGLSTWCETDPTLAPLAARLPSQRAQHVAPLAQFLEQGWGELAQALGVLRRALAGAGEGAAPHWQRPLLRRCQRRVQRALADCAEAPDAETWHRLRIRCKQWRYTLELLAAKPAQQKKLQRLRGLQQCLGEAQDAATFTGLLPALAQQTPLPPDCLLAIGRRQVLLQQQQEAALQRARRKLRSLLAD